MPHSISHNDATATPIPALRQNKKSRTPRSESLVFNGGLSAQNRRRKKIVSAQASPLPIVLKRRLVVTDQPNEFACSSEHSNCSCHVKTHIDKLFVVKCFGVSQIGGCDALTQTVQYKEKAYLVRFLWNEERTELNLTSPEYDEYTIEHGTKMIIIESVSLDRARIKFIRWIETSATF